MDAEKAHRVGFGLIRLSHTLGAGAALRRLCAPDPRLAVNALGLTFPSPFGLAAGFDKEGRGIAALTDLGFGHIEVGTITAQGQPGNPKPRLFRLVDDQALINRMGFNNDGAAAVAPRLREQREKLSRRYPGTRPVVGVNIGKTKKVALADAISDYLTSATLLAPYADYLVVNVSSPNTPGLRLMQSVKTLRPLLHQVRMAANDSAGRQVPLLVKIAPDLSNEDIADVAELALSMELDGIVCTNTTITRQGLRSESSTIANAGVGGLSGAPLAERSLEVLNLLSEATNGRITLISVGGVQTANDVVQRLDAGAHLVQGYTAFLYEGPFWVRRINRALRKRALKA